MFDIDKHTILLVLAGSRSYGTDTSTSDADYRGIAIPPLRYSLGLRGFKQYERREPHDVVIFSLRKFCELALKCNPNVIEQLFVDERHIVKTTAWGDELRANRHAFLSQRALHTFTGYAMAQLKRIKRHRSWLLNPPSGPPDRSTYGLPEKPMIPKCQLDAAVSLMRRHLMEMVPFLKEVDDVYRKDFWDGLAEILMIYAHTRGLILKPEEKEWQDIQEDVLSEIGRKLGFEEDFLILLSKEKAYSTAKREWCQYQEWLKNRNPARADLELRYGYDCKHAMHLVRLMRMGRELLETGQLIVYRPDREELLAIRNGAWTYDELIEWAETQDRELKQLQKTSVLPPKPNESLVEEMLIRFTLEFNGR